jgi:hypothetical protein
MTLAQKQVFEPSVFALLKTRLHETTNGGVQIG